MCESEVAVQNKQREYELIWCWSDVALRTRQSDDTIGLDAYKGKIWSLETCWGSLLLFIPYWFIPFDVRNVNLGIKKSQ